MKIFRSIFLQFFLPMSAVLVFASVASPQQPAPQQAASRFDITNYRVEAQLIPDQHMLRAGADITLIPLDATRSLVFELNGSLKVESIDRSGRALTYVQDAVGVGSLARRFLLDVRVALVSLSRLCG